MMYSLVYHRFFHIDALLILQCVHICLKIGKILSVKSRTNPTASFPKIVLLSLIDNIAIMKDCGVRWTKLVKATITSICFESIQSFSYVFCWQFCKDSYCSFYPILSQNLARPWNQPNTNEIINSTEQYTSTCPPSPSTFNYYKCNFKCHCRPDSLENTCLPVFNKCDLWYSL